MCSNANLYLRRNGQFGASCDGTQDTGHTILEDSGLFTVFNDDDPDTPIISDATREQAEAAIAADWRGSRSNQEMNRVPASR